MKTTNNEQPTTNNVLIAGGGLAGLTQALALAHHGIASTMVERGNHANHAQDTYDGRTSFLSLGNQKLYAAWGVWDRVEAHAEPVKDIRIVDGDSPMFLHYSADEVGVDCMGYIIENTHLRRALIQAVQANNLITVIENTAVEKAEADAHFSNIILSSGQTIKAKLVIAAEGKESPLRTQAGIKTRDHDYKQTAIICAFAHEKHHQNIAIEKFLPSGPFAVLPMVGGFHSAIVWSEKSELAPQFLSMDDTAFVAAVTERFADYLGKLKLVSPRWQYPLSLRFAETLYAERLALIGDTAHFIHPIAGQGFNQSIKDIAELTKLIAERYAVGLDIGTSELLQTYARNRRLDNLQMIAATDGLNRLFSNDLKTVTIARRIGLGLVEKLPALKKGFMRHAMTVKKSA